MRWIRTAAVLGFLAVAMGAFGAHALRERIDPSLMRVYQTGAHYHLVHAVALLALALYGRHARIRVSIPAWAFVIGITLFSGSLYGMAITGATRLGMITPLGGLCLLAGWLSLLLLRPG